MCVCICASFFIVRVTAASFQFEENVLSMDSESSDNEEERKG